MNDERKTKDQLIQELADLRQQLARKDEGKRGNDRLEPADSRRMESRNRELEAEIAQRQQREEELREKEEHFRIISSLASDYYYAMTLEADGSSSVDWVGGNFVQITGYIEEEIRDLDKWLSIIHPDDVARIQLVFRAVLANQPSIVEYRIRSKEGAERWLQDRIHPVWDDEQKRVVCTIGAVRDITERKRMEDALRESEARMRLITDKVPGLISYVDEDMRYCFANEGYERWFGMKREELVGKKVSDVLDEAAFRRSLPFIQRALNGEEVTVDGIATLPDGSSRYFVNHMVPNILPGGTVEGYFVLVSDITEYKQAEEALRESEERFRRFSEAAFEGIAITEKGKILDINPRLAEMLGWESAELIGSEVMGFVAPESRESVLQNTSSGNERPYEHMALRKDGSTFPVEVRGKSIPYQGRMVRVTAIRDITERKQAEQALRESEERYRVLFESAPDIVWLHDLEGNILSVNDIGVRQLGYSRGELLSMNLRAVASSEVDISQKIQRLIKSEDIVFESVHRRKDGSTYPVEVHAKLTELGGKQVVFSYVREITERKRMEEELRRANNLESLGLLAGGIAHDFNNVLTGVIGSLSLLEMMVDEDNELYEIVKNGRQAADRTRNLTQQLMTFAKGGAPVKKTASIEELLTETTSQSLHGSKARPEYHFAEDLLSANIDTGQIGQVIQNLVLNADQAMPGGGILSISAENVEISAGDTSPLDPGWYIRVSIEDQGTGMSDKIVKQIFDPYFSTKPTGHGLGLSITHSIISRHGGYITVRSEIDVGTTFEFYLPASQGQVVTGKQRVKRLATGAGRILLMDDEETIHRMIGMALRMAGYDVESVYDGDRALQVYRDAMEKGEPFDAVIMDLTIPGGMGGKEAVARLLEANPRARVLVSSGYSNDPVVADYAAHGFAGRIVKPVDVEELTETVKGVLNAAE